MPMRSADDVRGFFAGGDPRQALELARARVKALETALSEAQCHRAEALAIARKVLGFEPGLDFLDEHGEAWIGEMIARKGEVAKLWARFEAWHEDNSFGCPSCGALDGHKRDQPGDPGCLSRHVRAGILGLEEVERQREEDERHARAHQERLARVRAARERGPCDRFEPDLALPPGYICVRCGRTLAEHHARPGVSVGYAVAPGPPGVAPSRPGGYLGIALGDLDRYYRADFPSVNVHQTGGAAPIPPRSFLPALVPCAQCGLELTAGEFCANCGVRDEDT